MVILHVKSYDESLFLFECTTSNVVGELVTELVLIHNDQRLVGKAAASLEEKAKFSASKIDPNQSDVLLRVSHEAKNLVSKKQLDCNICLTTQICTQALDIIKGSIQTLPSELQDEFTQHIFGDQGNQKEMLSPSNAEVWFAGKAMASEKKLVDFIGRNEKSKVVIKLQPKGLGPPQREPSVSEEQQKLLMLKAFQRQEELKRLEEDGDSSYLNAEWADGNALRRTFQGVENVHWKPA